MANFLDRILELRRMPAWELQAHPGNWRTHPKAQREAMAGILREVGIAGALLVYDSHRYGGMTILDGHLRAEIDTRQSWPCLVLNVTDSEADYILATHDPLAGLAESNAAALALLLRQVQSDEASVQAMLSGLAAECGMVGIAHSAVPAADIPVSEAAMLQQKWETEAGQLWVCGAHRVLCGDCLAPQSVARVMDGASMDTIIFDPPYDGEEALLAQRWPCHDALVFTDHRHALDYCAGWGAPRCLFAWDGMTSWYVPGQPLARGKFCWWFGKSEYKSDGAHYGDPGSPAIVTNTRGTYQYIPDPRGKHLATVFQSPNTQQDGRHPHSKPVDWIRLLIGNCTAGIVYDPCAGSGTTLVACEQLGRASRNIECSPAYVALMLERAHILGLTPTLQSWHAGRSDA